MKVGRLIENTEWLPGSCYDERLQPQISILLPTFRRAVGGLFKRSLEACLAQTLKDIEIIIIDDASIDGTKDIINEYMEADGRISCLRHPSNVGLPAISEYEGYLKARADYVSFAFDDDTFYPDALELLLQASKANPKMVCYGHMLMRSIEIGSSIQLTSEVGQPIQRHNIRGGNFIANNAVLLPKHVIEHIGLFDPHIAMARQCDWGFWRRLSEHYLLKYVDIAVGEIGGPSTTDSLGKTYPLDAWASEELMYSDRSTLLKPDSFRDVDVFSTEHSSIATNAATIENLAQAHASKRGWKPEAKKASHELFGKQVLVVTRDFSASTMLCFSYLPLDPSYQVRIVMPGTWSIGELSRASCLIIVREFKFFSIWVAAAKSLGIPIYYFLDDNFTELQAKEVLGLDEDFSISALKDRLTSFSGVLLSSRNLLAYFEDNVIHHNLLYFPPSYCGQQAVTTDNKNDEFDISIAIAGGSHRHASLQNLLFPALVQLARKGKKIHLIIGGMDQKTLDAVGFEKHSHLVVTCLPWEIDWKRAILSLALYNPDVLVHPYSNTTNNAYKTLNCALTAHLLNAVLIVPNSPPYTDPAFSEGVVTVDVSRGPKAYIEAFQLLLSTPDCWQGYKDRNSSFCGQIFSGEENACVLKNILSKIDPVNFTIAESRLKTLLWQATGPGATAIHEKLYSEGMKISLLELSKLRGSVQKLRRILLFWRSPDNIWPSLSSNFRGIARDKTLSELGKEGAILEFSESLTEIPYVEYAIWIEEGMLKRVECAFASEGVNIGNVGIEIVSPSGEIVFHDIIDASVLDFGYPVLFETDGLPIEKSGRFFVRFFARSDWPIYLLNFVAYRLGRIKPRILRPFIKFVYEKT